MVVLTGVSTHPMLSKTHELAYILILSRLPTYTSYPQSPPLPILPSAVRTLAHLSHVSVIPFGHSQGKASYQPTDRHGTKGTRRPFAQNPFIYTGKGGHCPSTTTTTTATAGGGEIILLLRVYTMATERSTC